MPQEALRKRQAKFSIPLRHGDRGKNGKNGKNGKDGKDGKDEASFPSPFQGHTAILEDFLLASPATGVNIAAVGQVVVLMEITLSGRFAVETR